MCKHNPKNDGRRIDPCMRKLVEFLNKEGIETVSCCCGHGKYPMTIFVKILKYKKKVVKDCYLEICHDIYVESKGKFYKKDEKGFYYVPEVLAMSGGKTDAIH